MEMEGAVTVGVVAAMLCTYPMGCFVFECVQFGASVLPLDFTCHSNPAITYTTPLLYPLKLPSALPLTGICVCKLQRAMGVDGGETAVSVHLVGGVWGILSPGLLAAGPGYGKTFAGTVWPRRRLLLMLLLLLLKMVVSMIFDTIQLHRT